ncbi:unnamed protein product [Prunus armeniaca]|uniref:Uncharacterized protein n=1 Tax=Prunus armeniaca TaxID=36596 RepID=A0A6J5W3G0_PRUAR|nr:unnamed protein product [Prunus armeniaca]
MTCLPEKTVWNFGVVLMRIECGERESEEKRLPLKIGHHLETLASMKGWGNLVLLVGMLLGLIGPLGYLGLLLLGVLKGISCSEFHVQTNMTQRG